jgi:hypothetical protein
MAFLATIEECEKRMWIGLSRFILEMPESVGWHHGPLARNASDFRPTYLPIIKFYMLEAGHIGDSVRSPVERRRECGPHQGCQANWGIVGVHIFHILGGRLAPTEGCQPDCLKLTRPRHPRSAKRSALSSYAMADGAVAVAAAHPLPQPVGAFPEIDQVFWLGELEGGESRVETQPRASCDGRDLRPSCTQECERKNHEERKPDGTNESKGMPSARSNLDSGFNLIRLNSTERNADSMDPPPAVDEKVSRGGQLLDIN